MRIPLYDDLNIVRVGRGHEGLDFRPPLESAIVNPLTREVIVDEVDDVEEQLRKAVAGGSEINFVAGIAGESVLGVMGFRPVGDETDPMRRFATFDQCAELVNAYTLREHRKQGLGRALVGGVEQWATELGYQELVLNSGPRYMRSGWPFWRRVYGDEIGKIDDHYGEGFHALVWRTDLRRVHR